MMAEPIVRPAMPDDVEGILKCHAEIEAVMGKEMDLPAIDDPAILEFLVAELDGEIIGFHYQEKCIEMCHGGLHPLATRAFQQHRQTVFDLAKKAGVRFVHCQVPNEFPTVGSHLEDSGFRDKSEIFRHYVLDLRE